MIGIGTLSWLGVGRERQVGTMDDTGATGTTDPILIIPDKFEGAAETTYQIKITLAGIQGVARYQYSDDNGATWSIARLTHTNYLNTNKGIKVKFPAGTYILNDVWKWPIVPWGTAVTVTDYLDMLPGENLIWESAPLTSKMLSANRQRKSGVAAGVISASGTVPTEFQTEGGIWHLLYQALGGYAWTQLNAAPLVSKHVFRPAGADKMYRLPDGLTLRMNKGGDNIFQFYGGYVNSLTFKQDMNALLLMDAEFMARGGTAAEAPGTDVPTYASYDILSFAYCTLNINGVYQEASKLNVTLTNNLLGDKRALGTRERVYIPAGGLDVKGTFNVEFDDLAVFDAYKNLTPCSLEACWEGTTITGVHKKKLTIKMPLIYYTGAPITVAGEGLIAYDVPFESKYKTATSEDSITLELINTDNKYAV